MCELTEVMRKKGDHKFIEILNNIKIEKQLMLICIFLQNAKLIFIK